MIILVWYGIFKHTIHNLRDSTEKVGRKKRRSKNAVLKGLQINVSKLNRLNIYVTGVHSEKKIQGLQGGVSLSTIFSSDQLNTDLDTCQKVFVFFVLFWKGTHLNNKWPLTLKSLQAPQWVGISVWIWSDYLHLSSCTLWWRSTDSWHTWVGAADSVGQLSADVQAEHLLLAVHRVPSLLGKGVEIKQITYRNSQKVIKEEPAPPCQSHICWMTDLWRGCWPCSCRAGWRQEGKRLL